MLLCCAMLLLPGAAFKPAFGYLYHAQGMESMKILMSLLLLILILILLVLLLLFLLLWYCYVLSSLDACKSCLRAA